MLTYALALQQRCRSRAAFFDLIISNNGINNVDDDQKALDEITRVAKDNAQFVVTMNLPDTFSVFYQIFKDVLNHFFIKLAFLPSWVEVVGSTDAAYIFQEIQKKLDDVARKQGGCC